MKEFVTNKVLALLPQKGDKSGICRQEWFVKMIVPKNDFNPTFKKFILGKSLSVKTVLNN